MLVVTSSIAVARAGASGGIILQDFVQRLPQAAGHLRQPLSHDEYLLHVLGRDGNAPLNTSQDEKEKRGTCQKV